MWQLEAREMLLLLEKIYWKSAIESELRQTQTQSKGSRTLVEDAKGIFPSIFAPPLLRAGSFLFLTPVSLTQSICLHPPEIQLLILIVTSFDNGNMSWSEVKWRIFPLRYLKKSIDDIVLGQNKHQIDRKTHYPTANNIICNCNFLNLLQNFTALLYCKGSLCLIVYWLYDMQRKS